MSSAGTIRSFIAVPIPSEVREAVAAALEPLRGAGDVRWVRPEQYHLTLKFLGDATPAQLDKVAAGLHSIANTFSPFVIQLAGVGAFPRVERPSTLWVGIAAGAEGLAALAGAVERVCEAAGFPREARPFRAHLTVGRVRSNKEIKALIERLRATKAEALPPFSAGEVVLMESDLRPGGPIHTLRERCRLEPGE